MNHLPTDPNARDLAIDYHDRHGYWPTANVRAATEPTCPDCGCDFGDCTCDDTPIHGQIHEEEDRC